MTCDRIRPLLSDYHDDALSPRQQARVRAHVAGCPSCRAALEGYDHLYTSLRRAPVAVPQDLRRDVYAGIARLESGRSRPLIPFAGPTMWGALRAAGGTAGLLAVLGGLVFATIHIANAPGPTSRFASAQSIDAAGTVVAGLADAVSHNRTRGLPPEALTAVAPIHGALAGAVPMTVSRGTRSGPDVSVPVNFVRRGASGAPRSVVQARVVVAMHNSTPVVSGVAVSKPSPAVTPAPGDGLAYLRLDDRRALIGDGNSRAVVAFHGFTPSARPTVLVSPLPGQQLFTGLTVDGNGHTVLYSAMGQGRFGGVFSIDPSTLHGSQLVRVSDAYAPDAGGPHYFVKQVYATGDGPLLFSVVNQRSATDTVTIGITGSQTGIVRSLAPTPLRGSFQFWYDYVMAPDRHAIAWTAHPDRTSGIGALEVVDRTTRPVTISIGLGGHPIWSPDGHKILYESDSPPGLYVWSARTPSKRVVALPSLDQPALDEFAWAPNGRFFAYVLRTDDTSMVRIGDSETGLTWPAFDDKWIGAIAWARMPATTTPPAPTAIPTASGVTGASVAGATSAPPAPAATTPAAAHPLFDNTDSPVDVLHSFYNAIDRREYERAFGYLYNLPGDIPNFAVFKSGYDATFEDTVSLIAPRYQNGAADSADTCVGFALTARQTNGAVKQFGGWYMVKSTTGRSAVHGGWRIVMDGSHITEGGHAAVPPQSQCIVPSRATTVSPTPPAFPQG